MRLLPFVLLCTLTACTSGQQDLVLPLPLPVETPAASGSLHPFAASWGDSILLSWTEAVDGGHALRFAVWDGNGWSAPGTVTSGPNWFVNWADFPSVAAVGGAGLVAHWLQRSGPGRYAYDVVLSGSSDAGRTWSAPVRPHRDGTETEHGFVSIFPHGDGAGVIWLDGRQYAAGPHGPATNEMGLRFTTWSAAGLGPETLLDDRVCDCCQTAVAQTGRGPIAVYRGRTDDEVRDIGVVRFVDGAWSEPRFVHSDGWTINACPVNGPAVDAHGDNVTVAWFTAANDSPRVRLAFSADAGETFDPPLTIDDGHPVGRVDVLSTGDGRTLVVWLERVGDDAEIRGRLVSRDGALGPSAPLATTTAGRASGFPRMARRGSQVLLAWTEPGEESRVRSAVLNLGR
ncbi:hypothetical protein BH23GEM9_BH23GEM9_21770 [soil metagenome]